MSRRGRMEKQSVRRYFQRGMVRSKRRQVKTATSQNGDKPKRLQVQSKRMNLLSSTMNLLVNFLLHFSWFNYAVFAVKSLVINISRAQICFALTQALRATEYCTFWYNLTVASHICVQPTVDYIGFTRTVGVVWVCRRLTIVISVAVSVSPFWP